MVPPEACGWVLADDHSDQITGLHSHIVGQVLQVEVVTSKVIGEFLLSDNLDL